MGAATKGYLPITRTWQNGDVVQLELPMAIRRVTLPIRRSSPTRGRVAIARGPMSSPRGARQRDARPQIVIPNGASLSSSFDGGLLGGVVKITGTSLNADTRAARRASR
jgi:DUF1680 family protein